jgi:hypothetical protein
MSGAGRRYDRETQERAVPLSSTCPGVPAPSRGPSTGRGVACEVMAPSLIPVAPGDRVKTDRRDARRLVRQFRAGELVAIRVPSPSEEAVRDLCRARGDAVEDLTRAKNRLGHFLLRHGRIYRGATPWTFKHRGWLGEQRFDEAAAQATFARYRVAVKCRESELEAIEADLAGWVEAGPFAGAVRRLSAYRGVERLGALVLQAEVCDWRRPWRVDPRRQRPLAPPAGRGSVGVPQRPEPGRRPAPPPGGRRRGHRQAGVGRPGRPVRPLPGPRRPQAGARRGGGRRGPPPGRLPVGGDGSGVNHQPSHRHRPCR